jgi:type 1 fimbriae regulatory protein FimB/type 1 fimbriae regulatory protein FimE
MPDPPKKLNNKHEREHEWITYDEFKKIRQAAASTGRHQHRDELMTLMAFRHGLRAAELVGLKWSQVDLSQRTLDVIRKKGGKRGTHDLTNEEVRMLKRLAPEAEREGPVFRTERGGPLSTNGFFKIVQRAGDAAGVKKLHPHMFRHACGFYMVDKGVNLRVIQDWLGHRNIQMTVIYTELAPGRLRGAFPEMD